MGLHLRGLDAVGPEQLLAGGGPVVELDVDLADTQVVRGLEAGVGKVFPGLLQARPGLILLGPQPLAPYRNQGQLVLQPGDCLPLGDHSAPLLVQPGGGNLVLPGQALEPIQLAQGKLEPLFLQLQ